MEKRDPGRPRRGTGSGGGRKGTLTIFDCGEKEKKKEGRQMWVRKGPPPGKEITGLGGRTLV